ncbi:hypothetical protein Bca4012_064611 [Brassica carinata]|uniref:Uncharacterized protein n=1 Tax=Brassica carinata TaxID=52824 RepID=A0A8X7VMP5_BRACI|nr:hypothetical protein Bca52824_017104 [Brassica carinata]
MFPPMASSPSYRVPRFRMMPDYEVEIFEFGDFLGHNNHTDHHSDMRLDIEEMSYEVSQSFTLLAALPDHRRC